MALIRSGKTPVKKTVLWTNSSPNQSYAGGTITAALSDYDQLEIRYKGSTSDNSTASLILNCDELKASNVTHPMNSIGYIIAATGVWNRPIYKSTDGTGISIAPCYGGTGTTDNQYAVPLEVIGISL